MPKPFYYLTFRRRAFVPSGPSQDLVYGRQATVFTDKSPGDAYRELKESKCFAVAYGREGEKPIKDSHPNEAWDCDAGEMEPSGAKS